MHRLTYLILLLIGLCLVSCNGSKYPSSLLMADSLIDVNPDSAAVVLKQMNGELAKTPESTRRYHQLLSIKAADKTNQMQVSPDSIKELVRYFEEDGDESMLPLAYYYAGRVYSDLNEAPISLTYFQKSLDTMDKDDVNSLKLKSTIYSQMGYLYLFQYIYDEAERCFRASYNIGVAIQDTTSILWGLRDLGITFQWQNRYNESLEFLRKAEEIGYLTDDISMHVGISKDIAGVLEDLNNFKEARTKMELPLQNIQLLDSLEVYTIMSRIYYDLGKTDSLLIYSKTIEDNGNAYAKKSIYKRLTDIYIKKGQMDKAESCFKRYVLFNDSVEKLTKTTELQRVYSIYNLKKEEAKSSELEKQKLIRDFLLFVLLMILLSLSTYIYSYRRKNLERFKRFRMLQREIQRNSQYDVKANKDSSELNRTIIKSSHIYNVVSDKVASQLVLNDSDWQEIETLINENYPDFKTRLLDLYDFSAHQYHLCLLIKMELSPSSIGILTAHTNSSITHTRKRLYKKCFGQDGTGEQWDTFIRSL